LAVPGLGYILDPLLRGAGQQGRWIRVADLKSVGREHPVAVPVVGEQVDAWTKASAVRLGTVWLRVVGQDRVDALNAECPHLGCKVSYEAEKNCFTCRCHDSTFALDGAVQDGPAPRGMDPIETRVQDGQIEVQFKRYRTQIKERVQIG
jgi:cytochrome b6-f complex iron-sulfur subunit/menaquinol-cytochrome c reductase iron-sulfur subunit